MRTRAQKRNLLPELTQQLQRRLRALEAATLSTSAAPSPPAPKKRKVDDVSTSPLLLTPPARKAQVPTLSAVKIPSRRQASTTSVIKREALRRTLQYSTPAPLSPIAAPRAALERISSGCHADSIVQRQKELRIVRDVLRGQAEQGPSLFIIGPPGTGKSSSVKELLRAEGFESVATNVSRKRTRSSKVAVKLNCSMFTDPVDLYAAVVQLVRTTSDWNVPSRFDPIEMDKFLAAQDCQPPTEDHTIVVVLDEVDHLLRLPTQKQYMAKELLRFFVRWAALLPQNVKFLGIMNGVDMYAQVARVHSTTAKSSAPVPRVVFGSYTHQDLLVIMQSYVERALASRATATEGTQCIEPRALELIARKVAARDGDARLAISLLQQSARCALQRLSHLNTPLTRATIELQDVFRCATTMLASPTVHHIKQLPRQAKVLLYVITSLAPGPNASDGSLRPCDLNHVSEELVRLRKQPQTSWIPRLSREELQTHLMSLTCYALARQHGSKRRDPAVRPAAVSARTFWTSTLSSCVSMAQVARALQDDPSLAQLLF